MSRRTLEREVAFGKFFRPDKRGECSFSIGRHFGGWIATKGEIIYYIRFSVIEWSWCKSNSSPNYPAIYSENEFHSAANEGATLSLFLSENQQSSALDKGNYTVLLILTSVLCWNGKLRQDSNHLISDSHGRCLMLSGHMRGQGKR